MQTEETTDKYFEKYIACKTALKAAQFEIGMLQSELAEWKDKAYSRATKKRKRKERRGVYPVIPVQNNPK